MVSFDLFGTLIDIMVPSDPADAVAAELSVRGIRVPEDWSLAYREPHIDAPPGAETPLSVHVAQALRSRGVEPDEAVARRAVRAAFVPQVITRLGAREVIEAAARGGRIGVCSNCSVRGLATQALDRSDIECALDAFVTSADCGWRKPDPRVFETVASRLGASTSTLIHVGDDPATDGGIEAVGGTFIDVNEVPLTDIPERLEER